ncbi:cache domain-containing protein [Psychromonas sp. Urea-02u-13]|uniref:cache domain-containing protein n=1 Tax=Psychromonas sp. Urea-02u-13 TaxID=2058326 RepID=UPI001E38D605|nr:cache domain-containing protein [Psychromonas sp. Urea-02u-13]
MKTLVINENSERVRLQAEQIENQLSEKALGLARIAALYNDLSDKGTTEEFVKLSNTIAYSMNLNSSVIGFENGDGYWNQTSKDYPEHKYIGNINNASYYRLARVSSSSAMTEPYVATVYWVSLVHRIKNGMISVDMKLDFLSELVLDAAVLPGSVALIMTHDTTVLASSSKVVESATLATKHTWFRDAVQDAVSQESNVQSYQLNGVEKLIFSHRITVANKEWYYAIGLDTEIAYASLREAKQNAIISTVLATLISVLLAFFLLHIIYRPILALKETIIGLSQGNGDLTQRLNVS